MYTYIKLFNTNTFQSMLEEDVNKWLNSNRHNIEVVDIKVNNDILMVIYKAPQAY